MTLPVYNLQQPLVNSNGTVKQPWNSFFQQFTNPPSPVTPIDVNTSPFAYTADEPGQILINGATTQISFVRGRDTLDMTGINLITIEIKDIITVEYITIPTITFIPRYATK